MKKTLRYLFLAVCFMFILITMTGAGHAAPAVNKDAYRPQAALNDARQWPVSQLYQREGEVWPPKAGRYERKNANGMTNAYINVTVLPDECPVVNLHACDYNAPNDEHGWEALDTNPGIWLGGTLQPAQMGLAFRFVIGAKTIGIYRGNGIREVLPKMEVFRQSCSVTSKQNKLIVDYSGKHKDGVPDIRGEYVLNPVEPDTADEYSAFALAEILNLKEAKTSFFDEGVTVRPEAIFGTAAKPYHSLIGDYGFSVKMFQNGTLVRTFILPQGLTSVYRFDANGNNVMIYNIDGSRG